tara:strand:- start:17 stop:352 length:336 start_codon:yes stop_codon:yes gene_type:complete
VKTKETISSALAAAKSRRLPAAILLLPTLVVGMSYLTWDWGIRRVDTSQAMIISSLAKSVSEQYGIEQQTVIRQIESEFDVHTLSGLSQRQYRCVVDRLSRWLASGRGDGS